MKEWIEDFLKRLNLVNDMNQPEGFSRLGYTEEETKSIEIFKQEANSLGLHIKEDQAGNVIAEWKGSNEKLPSVASGSHLDTVHNGGGYDGVAGVLCALGAIKKLKSESFNPIHSIEVIVFRAEESARFGVSTIGSKAMSGQLNQSIGGVKDNNGISIESAVNQCGYNWNNIAYAERSENDLKTFVELHIEQGTQIEDHQKDFGVVRGIATPIRLKVKVTGQAGHTGTTPMSKRKDAFVASAPLVSFIDEYTTQLNQAQSTPVVATVSTANVLPNAMNVIPEVVELGVDIRSVDDSLKKQVKSSIHEECSKLSNKFGVSFEIDELVNNKSVVLDRELEKRLLKIGEPFEKSALLMDSGAGHDVMNMATKCSSGLIFIPCKDGLSHHPKEQATLDNLYTGIKLLTQYYRQEAGKLV